MKTRLLLTALASMLPAAPPGFTYQAKPAGPASRPNSQIQYRVKGISKDDFIFGVQPVDRDGNASVAVYPPPSRPPRVP